MTRLLIVGAGGHGRSLADAVLQGGQYQLAGFVDDGWARLGQVWGLPVLGGSEALMEFREHATHAIVAIGNNSVRAALHVRLLAAGFDLATVVHHRAVVSPRATLGRGCAVMAGAIVGTEASLGDGVIVNSGAVVDHHCQVSDFAHLGVGACMAGGAVLGRGAWMQAGAALGYGMRLDPDQVLAHGLVSAREVKN